MDHPVFDPSIHNYYVTVPFDVDTITVDTEELLTHFVEKQRDYVQLLQLYHQHLTL